MVQCTCVNSMSLYLLPTIPSKMSNSPHPPFPPRPRQLHPYCAVRITCFHASRDWLALFYSCFRTLGVAVRPRWSNCDKYRNDLLLTSNTSCWYKQPCDGAYWTSMEYKRMCRATDYRFVGLYVPALLTSEIDLRFSNVAGCQSVSGVRMASYVKLLFYSL